MTEVLARRTNPNVEQFEQSDEGREQWWRLLRNHAGSSIVTSEGAQLFVRDAFDDLKARLLASPAPTFLLYDAVSHVPMGMPPWEKLYVNKTTTPRIIATSYVRLVRPILDTIGAERTDA